MLRRARSGHRHFSRLLYHSQPRWLSSLPYRISTTLSSLGRDGENPQPESTSGFTGKIPKPLSKIPPETSKFLAMIEEMSSKDMGREEIVKRFQSLPSNVLNSPKTACAFAQEMAANACPDRVVHVLYICHRLGTVLAHNQYEQVVYQLASRNHWDYVYRVAIMAEKHTGRWTVRLLNWVVRSLIEMRRHSSLPVALDLFKRDQLRPTRTTYHLLLRGHLQNADLPHARKCLTAMRDAGFEMDKSTYLTILGAYRILGPNEDVEERAYQTLQSTREASDNIILNCLMQLRIDAGDTAGVLRILKLFAIPPLGNDGIDDNGTASARHESSRATPDMVTYNILLAFLARRKDALPNVLRIFGQIPAAGLRADAEAVASLIHAHFSAGLNSTAVAIVAEMCAFHNMAVDAKEFKVIGHCADRLDNTLPYALFVRPTTRIFNALLQGVLPEHGFLGIRSIFRMMQQAEVIPDAFTIQIILSYLHDVQHVRPRTLIRVLRILAAFPTVEATPTIQHANLILRSLLSRERDIVRTKSWNATAQRVRLGHLARFSVDRLSEPAQTFDPTAGISLKSFNRSVRKLFQPVIQSLLDNKVMSNSMTFALSIRRNAMMKMDMDSAQRVFDIMVARGIRPNAYHFSALMEGHVAQGDMDSAKRVMGRAALSGVASNVVMYTILIIGYGRQRRPDLALRTFAEMKSAGVDPDFAAIDAVVSAFWLVRRYRAAREVLLDVWPLVAPIPPGLVNAPLRHLVQSFRALRGDTTAIQPSDSPRYRKQRLRARRQTDRTLIELQKWRRRLDKQVYDEAKESLSWSKEYMELNPMLHVEKF